MKGNDALKYFIVSRSIIFDCTTSLRGYTTNVNTENYYAEKMRRKNTPTDSRLKMKISNAVNFFIKFNWSAFIIISVVM